MLTPAEIWLSMYLRKKISFKILKPNFYNHVKKQNWIESHQCKSWKFKPSPFLFKDRVKKNNFKSDFPNVLFVTKTKNAFPPFSVFCFLRMIKLWKAQRLQKSQESSQNISGILTTPFGIQILHLASLPNESQKARRKRTIFSKVKNEDFFSCKI